MGVTRTAPWWLTWVLVGSLALLYLGERVFSAFGGASVALSLLGAIGVVACTILRGLSWKGAEGGARGVEKILLLGSLGSLLAVAIWFVSSDGGMGLLGINFATAAAESRYQITAQVIWVVLVGLSLFSLIGAQLALGAHRHARGAVAGVETLRVSESASAGLGVALLAAMLFVLGYVTSAKDQVIDLSYFRTAVPGTSTEAIVSELFTPLQVYLFFPETSEVKEEALRYFRRLGNRTGNVQIEEHDRLVSRALASEYQVGVDGTIVVAVGDRGDRIVLPMNLTEARPRLRSFDAEVQSALLGLVQDNRVVYMTIGHGELNDPASAGVFYSDEAAGGFSGGDVVQVDRDLPEWMRAGDLVRSTNVFEQVLTLLNYEIRELGSQNGLASEIPQNAAMVALLGPRTPFTSGELATLERYLDRGGSLLVALNPLSNFDLGPLGDRLGVRFIKTTLVNDVEGYHAVDRGSISDRQLIITNQFYGHPSTTSIRQAGENEGMLFVGPGYLEEVGDGEGISRVVTVEALTTTFADLDQDFEFDEGTEVRDHYALVIASQQDTTFVGAATPVEEGDTALVAEPAAGPQGEGEAIDTAAAKEWRALVTADAQIFSDPVLGNDQLGQGLLFDGARWLARDEAFAGTTESEEDVRIVHTKSEQVAWFWAIIVGAPLLVLGGGMTGVVLRRRKRGE